MDDAQKTKAQLIQDLATLRQRVAALESAETETPLNVRRGTRNCCGWSCASGIPTATVVSSVGQADRITGLIEQLLHFGHAHDQPVQAEAVDAGEGSPAPPHTRR